MKKLDYISHSADRAKDSIEKAINIILAKYNEKWIDNEGDVDCESMADNDYLVYFYLDKIRDENRIIRNECLK